MTNIVEIFWNDNCAPCRAMKPVLHKLAGEHDFTVVEKKITEHMDEVRALGIRGVPSIVVDGKVLWTGAKPALAAEELVLDALGSW